MWDPNACSPQVKLPASFDCVKFTIHAVSTEAFKILVTFERFSLKLFWKSLSIKDGLIIYEREMIAKCKFEHEQLLQSEMMDR